MAHFNLISPPLGLTTQLLLTANESCLSHSPPKCKENCIPLQLSTLTSTRRTLLSGHRVRCPIRRGRMASKVKVTVSPEKRLVRNSEKVSREGRMASSRPVKEGLQLPLRGRLEQQLKEGYRQMATEDRATSELYLASAWETLK